MVIRMLVENTTSSSEYASEHGLSLWIETENYYVLFDTGKTDLFIRNATQMGVDLASADLAILSHGHNDHGGGIPFFFKVNQKAPLYVHRNAFGPHFSFRDGIGEVDIGLDPSILNDSNRLCWTEGVFRINEEMVVFDEPDSWDLYPENNANLLVRTENGFQPDYFHHEQSLLIFSEGKTVLIAGCAHRGILNIIERAQKISKNPIEYVIGGFHLFSEGNKKSESKERVMELAERLNQTKCQYYTCHCTGDEPFVLLKKIMGPKIEYFRTGQILLL